MAGRERDQPRRRARKDEQRAEAGAGVRSGYRRVGARPADLAELNQRLDLAPHLFKFFLLGGDPAWQVPHGRPFAIAGVACACRVSNIGSANIRKTPTAKLTAATFIEAT
jgi:hypothetical protein